MSEADGHVIQVLGPVVEVEFPPEQLPAIYNRLTVEGPAPEPSGNDASARIHVDLEVMHHLGDNRVACIAMATTDGMVRGMRVVNSGGPIRVPVGEVTLGRMFNVLGEPIDG